MLFELDGGIEEVEIFILVLEEEVFVVELEIFEKVDDGKYYNCIGV